jgi:hypothetical protein
MSERSSRPSRHGLGSSARLSQTLPLRFDPAFPTPLMLSNDRHLLFDAIVAPAAHRPDERSRAVARSVRNVP